MVLSITFKIGEKNKFYEISIPHKEDKENGIITFGQRIRIDAKVVVRAKFRGGPGKDWDAAERSLFEKLNDYGLVDIFEHCIQMILPLTVGSLKDRQDFRTIDHIFADKRLEFLACKYLKDQ